MESSNEFLSEMYGAHPRHYVAVDCVIFGYNNGELKLLLYPRSFEPSKGNWSLPGGFVQHDESSDQAAARILKKTTGLDDIFMEQVAAFANPDREKTARVISLAYYALVRLDRYDENLLKEYGATWYTLKDMPELIFDHNEMVAKALAKLQHIAGYQLIGSELLPEMFTLTQLRRLYEAIFQRELDPGNFRKKILSLGILKRSNKKDSTESKKGAYYYSYHQEGIQEKDIGRIIKI
jgi:ADP-ribose pyrophosphatase YjhB (NUDIX family)